MINLEQNEARLVVMLTYIIGQKKDDVYYEADRTLADPVVLVRFYGDKQTYRFKWSDIKEEALAYYWNNHSEKMQ